MLVEIYNNSPLFNLYNWLREPKWTSSAPWAKTEQLCSVSQNGPALRGEPKRTRTSPKPLRLALPRCSSFHHAGNLQPLRRRPPPLCRPPLLQLHRASHLTQGPVYTGMVLLTGNLPRRPPPLKCYTNLNKILRKKCYHGRFMISWSRSRSLLW